MKYILILRNDGGYCSESCRFLKLKLIDQHTICTLNGERNMINSGAVGGKGDLSETRPQCTKLCFQLMNVAE